LRSNVTELASSLINILPSVNVIGLIFTNDLSDRKLSIGVCKKWNSLFLEYFVDYRLQFIISCVFNRFNSHEYIMKYPKRATNVKKSRYQ